MNIDSEILKEHSKRQTVRIGTWIGENRSRLRQLIKIFLHGEYRTTQRAAWIVSYCAEKHPRLIAPWIHAMVKKMQQQGVHIAVKRNVLRVLQDADIPRSHLGTVATICFDELASAGSPIAVRAYAMTVLAQIAKREPDIVHELRGMIEQMLPHAGPGIHARSRMVLKQLSTYRK